ncbi:hypothetical protein [Legionella impletisoli]|uniref:Uncharacterized protein n=1 Tax=Legionella impletisoli TaxID=343510 RepID=A0A917JNA6_9GAMM|nr:hypothetical protein [Legionella impletisoli]GGI78010.1 hypothetical protein GCM10007966_03360 [Legionella impletisoli]
MKKINFNAFSLAKIHETILQNTIPNVLKILGLNRPQLDKLLSHYHCYQCSLTVQEIRKYSVEHLATYFGDAYHLPTDQFIARFYPIPKEQSSTVNPVNPELSTSSYHLTLASIHQVILSNKSLDSALFALNLKRSQLETILNKFEYNGGNLTLQEFRTISVEELKSKLGNQYDGPISRERYTLNPQHEITLAKIHSFARAGLSLKVTSQKLGCSLEKIRIFLSQFSYQGVPLTFQQLNTMCPQLLQDVFQDAYTEIILKKPVDLSKLSLREIHATLLLERDSSVAGANRLGVYLSHLNDYLRQFKFRGVILNANRLKECLAEDLERELGDLYNLPLVQDQVSATNLDTHEAPKRFESTEPEVQPAIILQREEATLDTQLESEFGPAFSSISYDNRWTPERFYPSQSRQSFFSNPSSSSVTASTSNPTPQDIWDDESPAYKRRRLSSHNLSVDSLAPTQRYSINPLDVLHENIDEYVASLFKNS